MPFDTKILLNKIKKFKSVVDHGNFSDALVGSLNTGNALMQQRIFGDNKDINGSGFGVYIGRKQKQRKTTTLRLLSKATATDKVRIKRNAGTPLTPYQRKRVNKGRQIIKKDLEFSGGVRRSIEVEVINERSAVVQFNEIESAKIARGQENQITNIRNGQPGYTKGDGVKIFAFNEDEVNRSNEQVHLLINQIIQNELR